MKEMQEIHDEVLNILIKYNKKNPTKFFFTMRQTNRYNRLEKGYWFHGNDDYLAVSFWDGRDWKNKTPNIYFEVNRNKRCLFIFSAKDSGYKAKFAKDWILPILRREESCKEVQSSGDVIIFELGYEDYKRILEFFIEEIKPEIDSAVSRKREEYDSYIQAAEEYARKDDIMGLQEKNTIPESEFIGFIDPSEFQININRVRKYQLKQKLELLSTHDEFYIKTITINNAGDIRKPLTIDIPKETSWVFLTGENGCGKTTILRAITAFFNKEIKKKYSLVSEADIKIDSHSSKENTDLLAFAAYGPSRLLSTSCDDISDKIIPDQMMPWYSIFNPNGVLRGLEDILHVTSPKSENRLIDMINFLREMFSQKEDSTSDNSKSELIPQLAEVNFDNFGGNGKILYREKDNNNIPYDHLTKFEDLASGIRSMLALIGDLIIRLIERNPDEPDPSNFKAVVLIDEIDIHFHPSMQKKIVEVLSGNFPKVQFIVTTHSPVTLLGAPEHSVFYKIERTVEKGITAIRMEKLEKEIKNLLPNSILTSPIFGMDTLRPSLNIDIEKLNIDDHYNEKLLFEIIDDKIEEYYNRNI